MKAAVVLLICFLGILSYSANHPSNSRCGQYVALLGKAADVISQGKPFPKAGREALALSELGFAMEHGLLVRTPRGQFIVPTEIGDNTILGTIYKFGPGKFKNPSETSRLTNLPTSGYTIVGTPAAFEATEASLASRFSSGVPTSNSAGLSKYAAYFALWMLHNRLLAAIQQRPESPPISKNIFQSCSGDGNYKGPFGLFLRYSQLYERLDPAQAYLGLSEHPRWNVPQVSIYQGLGVTALKALIQNGKKWEEEDIYPYLLLLHLEKLIFEVEIEPTVQTFDEIYTLVSGIFNETGENSSTVKSIRDKSGNRYLAKPVPRSNFSEPRTNAKIPEKEFPLPTTKSGIFYGDGPHILGWPDELLDKHILRLKDRKVKVLFMEYFRSTEQPLLDIYFESPTGKNFSEVIRTLKTRGIVFGKAEQKLLKNLVANRIKPVGIELPRKSIRIDERDNHWIEVIKKYLKVHPGVTWAAFVGSTHLKGGGFSKEYIGVDQRLGVPSIKLEKLRKFSVDVK